MNTSPGSPFTLPDTAPELARRLALILAGLGALVARRFVRMPHLTIYTILLWGRLNRAVRRFARALAQPATEARAPRARAGRDDAARVRTLALPMGRGWLVRELGWEAAAYMSLLEALLAEMTTQAALARSPEAGRILRPICRMLGVTTSLAPQPAAQAPNVLAQGKPGHDRIQSSVIATIADDGPDLGEIFARA